MLKLQRDTEDHRRLGKMAPQSPPVVLVVDDRKDVAATLVTLCQALGYSAVAPDRPGDILGLLERHRPAALIMDVMMPEQDGYEALKEIASFDNSLPVLLVSGYGETWLRMGATLGEAHGLSALRTAAKPLRSETIRAFLSHFTAAA
jgi:CheY-like chemotaxis protein